MERNCNHNSVIETDEIDKKACTVAAHILHGLKNRSVPASKSTPCLRINPHRHAVQQTRYEREAPTVELRSFHLFTTGDGITRVTEGLRTMACALYCMYRNVRRPKPS
jgi:hypothetical protein